MPTVYLTPTLYRGNIMLTFVEMGYGLAPCPFLLAFSRILTKTMTIPETESETDPSLMYREANYQPGRSWRTWLIGRPLSTADAPHQAIGKFVGLAVFSSDAMSSVAYGPQEMMLVLASAGVAALGYAVPLAIAIVALLAILTLSYEQTIHAYPGGGGAYIVARDNLGELPAQTAGAALLTDYILTVAVSTAAGVGQLAWGEGVGRGLRGANLLFPGHDFYDGHPGGGPVSDG